jgi:hypothetical protein
MQGMEAVKGGVFSTTESFTTTHGFVIPTLQPPVSCATPATADRSRSSSSCSDSSEGTAAVHNNRQPADHPSTPVGWSGLLEISRCAEQLS